MNWFQVEHRYRHAECWSYRLYANDAKVVVFISSVSYMKTKTSVVPMLCPAMTPASCHAHVCCWSKGDQVTVWLTQPQTHTCEDIILSACTADSASVAASVQMKRNLFLSPVSVSHSTPVSVALVERRTKMLPILRNMMGRKVSKYSMRPLVLSKIPLHVLSRERQHQAHTGQCSALPSFCYNLVSRDFNDGAPRYFIVILQVDMYF